MFKKEFIQGCMLVTGGAKSGKSRISLDICNRLSGKKMFIATAQALDDEMKERIERHKRERGDDWLTIEEPVRVPEKILELDGRETVILIDCLTLWLSNLIMEHGESLRSVNESLDALIKQLERTKGSIILVSNEVGMGIVPENDLARQYRDMAGSLNQRIAAVACKVVAVIAGIPLILKDE